MFDSFREAWRIVRIAKDDGYKGPFVVLRETMMEEIQKITGRAVAENQMYIQVIDNLLDGKRICEFCEDCKECENHDKWLEGKCKEFMLKFPSLQDAEKTFEGVYDYCREEVERDDAGGEGATQVNA